MTSQVLGVVATGLVIVGYVPQILHLVKEHCTAGISVPAFSLWGLASFLFLIHAAAIGDLVFVAVQAVNVVAGDMDSLSSVLLKHFIEAFPRSKNTDVRSW